MVKCCLLVLIVAVVAAFVASSAAASSARRVYSGNGTVLLAPVTLTQRSMVSFTSRGGIFMLIGLAHPAASGPNPQLIVSQAPSGRGYLPPGRYRFKVGAFGAWRMVISP